MFLSCTSTSLRLPLPLLLPHSTCVRKDDVVPILLRNLATEAAIGASPRTTSEGFLDTIQKRRLRMLSWLSNRWDSFFHDRTGVQGCRVAGYMRIGFCLCFLIDKIMIQFFLDVYYSPKHGLMPYSVTRHNWELVGWNQKSLFVFFPESEAFLWIFSTVGILQGLIVLLGATKHLRFHMFGLYLNVLSFTNHNKLHWDGEDEMFRMWAFLLLFLPLDHCTIYDGFGFRSPSSWATKSWPMWTIRMFQSEIMLIYMGASLGKIVVKDWQDGSAIFRISYGIQDYPGIFNPNILFERYGPLKLLTWTSLLVEGICYLTVWIPALRNLSVGLMIAFHVGIDLSMNMHMFEWLSCVGWLVFLIQPETNLAGTKIRNQDDKGTLAVFKKAVINIFVASFIFLISMDTIPYDAIGELLPSSLQPSWDNLVARRDFVFNRYIDRVLTPMGLAQGGAWSMYDDVYQVLIVLRLDAQLTNGTIVKNVWRGPDWFAMTDWERKFHCRDANFFDMLPDSKNELLHFVEVISKPFVEENDVKILMVTKETRTHYNLKMESSGGFWSPVLKPPMDVHFDETALKLRVGGDCVNALPTCKQLIQERGCKVLVEQCRKSCSTKCSDFSSFVVEYWLDPMSDESVVVDFDDHENQEDDGYTSEEL